MEFLFLHWRNEGWLYATYFTTSLAVQFMCAYFLGKKHIPFFTAVEKWDSVCTYFFFWLKPFIKNKLLVGSGFCCQCFYSF